MAQSRMSDDQQKRVAMDLFLDAWDDACEAGINADLLAEVLMYLALTDLVADRGEEWVAEVIEGLPERVRAGEFTLSSDEGRDPEAGPTPG